MTSNEKSSTRNLVRFDGVEGSPLGTQLPPIFSSVEIATVSGLAEIVTELRAQTVVLKRINSKLWKMLHQDELEEKQDEPGE